MKLQQIVRYRLDFDSKALTVSGALMGLAFFLRSVHYFGLADLQQVGFSQLLLLLTLPMLLEAAWFMLLRGFGASGVGLYGILGALYCLLVMVQTVVFAGFLSAILAVPACIVAGLGVLLVAGGLVASRFAAVAALIITVALRFVFGGLPEGLLEYAALSGLFGLMSLFAAMRDPRRAR